MDTPLGSPTAIFNQAVNLLTKLTGLSWSVEAGLLSTTLESSEFTNEKQKNLMVQLFNKKMGRSFIDAGLIHLQDYHVAGKHTWRFVVQSHFSDDDLKLIKQYAQRASLERHTLKTAVDNYLPYLNSKTGVSWVAVINDDNFVKPAMMIASKNEESSARLVDFFKQLNTWAEEHRFMTIELKERKMGAERKYIIAASSLDTLIVVLKHYMAAHAKEARFLDYLTNPAAFYNQLLEKLSSLDHAEKHLQSLEASNTDKQQQINALADTIGTINKTIIELQQSSASSASEDDVMDILEQVEQLQLAFDTLNTTSTATDSNAAGISLSDIQATLFPDVTQVDQPPGTTKRNDVINMSITK